MKRKHYHVLVGLPGYIPASNYPCETLKEAGDAALYEANQFREAGYSHAFGNDSLGYVAGSKRNGYEVLRREFDDFSLSGYRWEVWQTITISPCDEANCRCSCGYLFGDEEWVCEQCNEERVW